jgi:hypothetical protein
MSPQRVQSAGHVTAFSLAPQTLSPQLPQSSEHVFGFSRGRLQIRSPQTAQSLGQLTASSPSVQR